MQTPDILRNRWVQLTTTAVVAFAGGSVGGYILGKRKRFQEQQWEVIRPSAEQLALFSSDPTLVGITELHTEAEVPIDRDEKSEEDDDVEPTPINVFTNDDGDWDWESELSCRESEAPYIIHVEEYIADEMGYKQETVTYYKADDIMADETDTPIYDYQGMMGELKFGHGSKDKNVVYIRSEPLHLEWEILLHQGSFELEVLGHTAEDQIEEDIKHAGVQKFRRE